MIKIFNHHFHKRTITYIFLDWCLVVATVAVSVLSRVTDPVSIASIVVQNAIFLAMGILAINAGLGFYQHIEIFSLGETRIRAVLSLCLSLPIVYVIFRFSTLNAEHENVFLVALFAALVLVLFHRIYITHTSPSSMLRLRVLVYGSGESANRLRETLKKSGANVNIVGYYAGPNESMTDLATWGYAPLGKSLKQIVQDERVDEIVVALSERRSGSMSLRELLDCKLHGIRVVDTATHFEKTMGQIRRDEVSAGWLIFGDGFEQGVLRTLVKRLFDIICATLLLVLTLPIMLITSILILLERSGPVLYSQERVGLNGKLFNVVKFRSMSTDAEKDGKPRWATTTDDRITRVGRVIRKLRIDELPQIFCVLSGDMSLVGPRPERYFFVQKLIQELPFYEVRLSVKPGLTGWAQVRYHYGSSVEDAAEKLQYDLYYVKNNSIILDFNILFKTIGVVLTGKGAH